MTFWLLRGSHHGYETGTIYVRGAPRGGFLGKRGGAGVWSDVVMWMGRAREGVARRPAGKRGVCGARGTLALWGGEGAGPCSVRWREVWYQTMTLRLSQLFILEKIQHTNAAKTAETELYYSAECGRFNRLSKEWFGIFVS